MQLRVESGLRGSKYDIGGNKVQRLCADHVEGEAAPPTCSMTTSI